MFNVLIVDDAPLIRERLKARLAEMKGVHIAGEADNVQEAIDAFHVLTPDAVILDIQMPGGTGIEVLETIKHERPETVVIMLTNYPLPQLQKKSADAGANYFFDKCCEFNRVVEVLKTLSNRGSDQSV